MKFLLIYWLFTANGQLATTGNASFDDQTACQGALQQLAQAYPADTKGAPGICVAESSDQDAPAPQIVTAPAPPSKQAPPAKNKPLGG